MKSYELPEIAGLYQCLINSMPNTGTRREVEAMGTEWETSKGTKSLIVLVRYQLLQPQTILWTIETAELESEPSGFEKAKNAYLYTYANAQINPQWVQYVNGQMIGNIRKNNEFWANAAAASAAAHRQRMNEIAARGNTSTSIGNTYSDILDISHRGYLSRSNINDSGHSMNIRAIHETTLIGNHETGEYYNIPGQAKYFWVSNDGIYIGTDNPLLDPNANNQLNQKNWTKFAVER